MKEQVKQNGLTSCHSIKLSGIAVLFLLIVGCTSTTEPVRRMPSINLSPSVMSFETDRDKNNSRDFGLSLATNESDSLDNLEVLPGLKVKSVRQGSPAALAGVEAGDIVLAVDASETNSVDAFLAIAEVTNKDQLELKALRDTTAYETSMQVPEPLVKSIPRELYRLDLIKTRAAYETQVLTNQTNNNTVTVAKVVELLKDSPLAEASVKNNDLISAINGNAVESAQDLINQLYKNHEFGEEVKLTIIRKGSTDSTTKEIVVRLWDPGTRINKLSFWPFFTYSSSLDPDSARFKITPIFGFSLFSYDRSDLEKDYSLLTFIKFSSGPKGDLIDVTDLEEKNDE